MSTLQVVNAKHPSSASNNIVLDASGNATFAGTAAMSSSFLRNRIINGDMRIDQRNAGASGTAAAYTVDRWGYYQTQASRFTWQQNAGSATPPAGFTNYLGFTSSGANAPISSDSFSTAQIVEGFNVSDLGWGAAGAQTVTLSFWVRSSLTGTHSGSLRNGTGARSYPFTFTVSAANTWEFKAVTIAGDTAGTWNTTNSGGVIVGFNLGAGSTFQGTAGSWAAGNFTAASGSVNVCATNGATFYLTGVQLEVGTAATPFERRQFGQELALCQRYYEASYNIWSGYVNGVSPYYITTTYKVTKRAVASISLSNTNNSGFPNTAATVGINTEQLFRVDPVSNASSTAAFYQFNWIASAEL